MRLPRIGRFDDAELRAPITRAGVAVVTLLTSVLVDSSVAALGANHAIGFAAVERHGIAVVALLAELAIDYLVTAVGSVLAIGATGFGVTVVSVRC